VKPVVLYQVCYLQARENDKNKAGSIKDSEAYEICLRTAGAVVFLLGWVLIAYALYQTYLTPPYTNKTVNLDMINVFSLIFIFSGLWIILRKKSREKQQVTSL
jgi:hypothetical protein